MVFKLKMAFFYNNEKKKTQLQSLNRELSFPLSTVIKKTKKKIHE